MIAPCESARAGLRLALDEVRSVALAPPSVSDEDLLRAMLERDARDLARSVAECFAREERALNALASEHPEFGVRLRRLRADHVKLAADIEILASRLLAAPDLDALKRDALALVERLRAHEEAEESLALRGAPADLGGGD